MLDNFFDFSIIIVVPLEINKRVDNLVQFVVSFKPPDLEHLSYIKQCKVFEDEETIKRFPTLIDEYSNMNIDFDMKEDGEDLETNHPHPKRMVPLKILFNTNDVPLNPS
jgi:hypothetical protein